MNTGSSTLISVPYSNAIRPEDLCLTRLGVPADLERTGVDLQLNWARNFLSTRIVPEIPKFSGQIIVVGHLRNEFLPFLETLQMVSHVNAAIPKPKSIIPWVLREVGERAEVLNYTREDLSTNPSVISDIAGRVRQCPTIIFDIGGYFASCLHELSSDENLVGVIEDTTNGHERYGKLDTNSPVVSIARSTPKRGNEDWHVGRDIVAGAQLILGEIGDSLAGKNVAIIGLGSIGGAINITLATQNYGIQDLYIKEVNPNALALAKFSARASDSSEILQNADVVFVAAPKGITHSDLPYLKEGAVLVSVTSADDSFEIDQALCNSEVVQLSEHLVKYNYDGKSFILANNGNAPNFSYNHFGAFPGLHCTHAMLLLALRQLLEGDLAPNITPLKPFYAHFAQQQYMDALYELQVASYDMLSK